MANKIDTMHRTMWAPLCLCFLLPAFFGCSSDSDDEEALTPVEKCDAFLDSYCEKAVKCLKGTSDEVTFGDCRTATSSKVDCSESKAVTSSYDTCMNDITNMACPSGDWALPSSCNKVILQSNVPPNPSGLGILLAPAELEPEEIR
jgi:hypothetical protein